MKTRKIIEVPTGHILIVDGEKGQLECLSIGDYGKDVNIKASFLGLDRDIGDVKHTGLLPLEEKWVITISTQYGCSSRCRFCDVPKVGPGLNATVADLVGQFEQALAVHPEVLRSDRVNLHYARMGEPTWNQNVIHSAYAIDSLLRQRGDFMLHPVVSTMLPRKNRNLEDYLLEWCDMKNGHFLGNAGLQLSINSTCDIEREIMFGGSAKTLAAVCKIADRLPMPIGRKYALNFAVADYTIDAEKLADMFDSRKFMVKLTPMHKTDTALRNGIQTDGNYSTLAPYQKIEESIKKAGFDVLVFIASHEEDMGRITCGNAILSGTMPEVHFSVKELA